MDRDEILNSGLLELYSLGCLAPDETQLVETALSQDPLLAQDLQQIEETLLFYAQANAISPHPSVKPLLLAKIEYMNRLKAGEVPTSVPLLTSKSSIQDFNLWLSRPDMQLNDALRDVKAIIIADEPEKFTSIIWLKYGVPPEIHTAEHEKFLVVEGTCNFVVGTQIHSLRSGDYLEIPLHVSHKAEVTSEIPCKIILQRVKEFPSESLMT